jgi:hypothetical protein
MLSRADLASLRLAGFGAVYGSGDVRCVRKVRAELTIEQDDTSMFLHFGVRTRYGSRVVARIAFTRSILIRKITVS